MSSYLHTAPSLGQLVAHLTTHLANGGSVHDWPGLPSMPAAGGHFVRPGVPMAQASGPAPSLAPAQLAPVALPGPVPAQGLAAFVKAPGMLHAPVLQGVHPIMLSALAAGQV